MSPPSVCITPSATSLDSLLQDTQLQAAMQGPHARSIRVELRLDRMPSVGPLELRSALEHLGAPRVVVTCRAPEEGGGLPGVAPRSEARRRALWEAASAAGAGFIDMERATLEQNPLRFRAPTHDSHRTKLIVSTHTNRSPEPAQWARWRAESEALGADVVKIVGQARHITDSLVALLQAQQISPRRVPLIALATGEAGVATRCLVGRAAHMPPLTYVALCAETRLVPGQLTLFEATERYAIHQVSPKTAVFGVIGAPIAHSGSPRIHNETLRRLELDAIYLPPLLVEGDPTDFLSRAPDIFGLRGVSVTLPHKQMALKSCNHPSQTAALAGAINTLYEPIRAGHTMSWRGENTDGAAAYQELCEMGHSCLTNTRVLLLGAGGVARGIGAELVSRGAELAIWARNAKASAELAQLWHATAIAPDARLSAVERADIVVQCTPLGMAPQQSTSILDEDELRAMRPGALIFDTVYNPRSTVLLEKARHLGIQTLGGDGMFRRQANLQAQLFYGIDGLDASTAKTNRLRKRSI